MRVPAWLGSPALADLARLALEEDGIANDVTSAATVPYGVAATATIAAKEAGRIAGLPLLLPESPLIKPFAGLASRPLLEDGSAVAPGTKVAELRGPARTVLAVERTLLNFLQRLSGIATITARYVAACAGTKARILETRKTCPGFRALDKYAVLMGGGFNHRAGLSDQVLVKENHLLFCGAARSAAAVREAIRRARASGSPSAVVEIEVETLEQLQAALEARADIVLLDNMTQDQLAEAVKVRRAVKSTALLEASGGITLENVGAIAACGIDRISVGALTHSVKALDLALDLVPDARR
jgi:nicotinate-nucleotide pyrophosphorylase (carboxylating)